MVLLGDLLQSQMLFHGDRVVGAALDRRIVGDNRHFLAFDRADAGHDPRRGRLVVIHAVRGQRRKLEERRVGIHQPLDSLSRQQLSSRSVPLHGLGTATLADAAEALPQVLDEPQVVLAILSKLRRERIDARLEHHHAWSG